MLKAQTFLRGLRQSRVNRVLAYSARFKALAVLREIVPIPKSASKLFAFLNRECGRHVVRRLGTARHKK